MLDIKLIQNDFDTVATALRKKKVDESLLEELRAISLELKSARLVLEPLQAEQNAKSKLFGVYAKEGKDVGALKAELSLNKEKIAEKTEVVRALEEKLEALATIIPNMPSSLVPEGEDENDNVELKRVLEPKTFSFTPKEHWDIDSKQNWIDFERGVKLAKSRFSVLKNDAARLERALINYMLDFNRSRGFHEVAVPYIVNRETLMGTGQLPKFEDDLFKIDGEELFLIPTAEVPVTNLFRDEILSKEELPLKMTAYSACFRKEAGSAGKDTRGMIRQHQFDKVELVSITTPEQSETVFEEMLSCASDLLSSLGLPHRHLMLCGGDLGFSAAKTVDLEVWLPGQNRYREISSVSNTFDFQARRAKIRFKDEGKNRLVHTLNGSSLAVGRTLIAIMENYQQEDGSVAIPEVLKKYM
ncbi:serine--tRNA ligase [Sulfurospirillum deleyianum]|uniref:Serine--tRNA ligase n=1 Tax=Sulfurospirillum deleyianum (strain ATCC 51133 / DSM 6946 / 5175) TaxID=525898 RepID=D1B3V1_SULD5|nr:serine--tRNA ligase [Sulfurospirillum deleyianum]ACZ12771.1 seryl-tRNA synthetase [Sulfurospirillum deleyianum DSM 6946]